MVDNMFLAIYIVEFLLKFYAWRLRYFKLGWNIFDIQLSAVHSIIEYQHHAVIQYICTIMGSLLYTPHDIPWLQSRLCDHNCKFCGLSSSTDCPECCWHFWHKGLWSAYCVQVLSRSEGTQSTADHQVRVKLNLNSLALCSCGSQLYTYVATMYVCISLTHSSLSHSQIPKKPADHSNNSAEVHSCTWEHCDDHLSSALYPVVLQCTTAW